ncbi:MAG: LysR family transcriptional regulator [Oscillospiraceae bacterium]|nr:LysR family transcriptional regulator [Oscillospiraceae bacterium]
MYNITFEQIYVFLTVAEVQSFTKAADQLFTSQPALSRTLARFEESVGVRVFERSNKGVVLTREGEYLRQRLEPLYTNLDAAIKVVRSGAAFGDMHLRLALPVSYNAVEDYKAMNDTIRRFQSEHPEIYVAEILCDFQEMRQQLELGTSDIIVAQSFVVDDLPNICSRKVAQYNMYLAISADHPLAKLDEIEPHMLNGETAFFVPQTNTQQDKERAKQVYARIGFVPKSVEFVLNYQTLLHNISACRGVSICGKFNVAGSERIKYYPIDPSVHTSRIVVCWKEGNLSKEARAFLELVPAIEE